MNPQLRRLILDLGPLLVFFIVFKLWGFFPATAAFMTAMVTALAIGYALERKLSPIPLLTTILVLIFGGLTLYLKNETYLKVKFTIVYVCFAAILLGGLATRRLFLKYVFAQAFELDDAGWKKLTWRWSLFFLALATLNEVIWRHTSTEVWVNFKVWGAVPLTFLFALAQTPLILKHQRGTDTQP
jgi:intracellular septation protein